MTARLHRQVSGATATPPPLFLRLYLISAPGAIPPAEFRPSESQLMQPAVAAVGLPQLAAGPRTFSISRAIDTAARGEGLFASFFSAFGSNLWPACSCASFWKSRCARRGLPASHRGQGQDVENDGFLAVAQLVQAVPVVCPIGFDLLAIGIDLVNQALHEQM